MSRKFLAVSIPVLVMLGVVTAYAEEHNHADHQGHMAHMGGDQRQLVEFPPEVRVHFLSNMRGHLQALSDITLAMSDGQYDKAADIADTTLGMDSPSAAGCKMGSSLDQKATPPEIQDHQRMQQYMPPLMRQAGIEMHQTASDFAIEVRKVSKTGDSKLALSALSRVTQRCISCHASFRAQ